jgi:hypothetical protein
MLLNKTQSYSPFLRLLQVTTRITKKLVFLTQHLARAKLSEARGDTRVLLYIDG